VLKNTYSRESAPEDPEKNLRTARKITRNATERRASAERIAKALTTIAHNCSWNFLGGEGEKCKSRHSK
jgi:hypothetical protein